ncbi:MAG: IS66 family transposase [Gammaproteobacteria bacterium]|jgi:transposase
MHFEQRAESLSPSEVAALITSHRSLEENYRCLEHSKAQLEARVEELKRQLEWFKQQLFGSKSERRLIEPSPEQLSLGEDLRPASEDTAPRQQIAAHTRRRRTPGNDEDTVSGLKFDASIPVEVIELEDPEVAGLGADEIEPIGEKVTYRLAQQKGGYVILKYVRKVLKRKDTGSITCAPAPGGVIERSHADVSFLAGLVIDKFQYHLPLYRQHQRLKQAGIEVSRPWLTQLVHRTAALLEPVYEAQLASIRASGVIAMDETPIKAGHKSRGKLKTTYFWPLYGDQDEVAFPWFASRASPNVKALLGEYSGTLLSDGYAAYARYAAQSTAIVHAQCWAHARRHFCEAEPAEPALAAAALERIGVLYRIEQAIAEAELEGAPKLAHRLEHAKPVVDAFFGWCEDTLADQALLPSNPLTKALGYVLERRVQLGVFVSDPDVPIDTNHLERALRPIPMGRKNWLFCWTEVGAKYVGVLQSLLSTCRLHQIHPYDYLVDVLQRIDSHPAKDVRRLTPRLWKASFAADPMRAPLDNLRQ